VKRYRDQCLFKGFSPNDDFKEFFNRSPQIRAPTFGEPIAPWSWIYK
jgi:hypothetical protein